MKEYTTKVKRYYLIKDVHEDIRNQLNQIDLICNGVFKYEKLVEFLSAIQKSTFHAYDLLMIAFEMIKDASASVKKMETLLVLSDHVNCPGCGWSAVNKVQGLKCSGCGKRVEIKNDTWQVVLTKDN